MSVERAGRLQRCRSTKSRVHACLEANEMAPRFRNYGCMAGASSNFSTWRCHPLLTISPTHATFDPFYLDSRVISRKICCCQCQWRLSPNGISLSLSLSKIFCLWIFDDANLPNRIGTNEAACQLRPGRESTGHAQHGSHSSRWKRRARIKNGDM